MKHNFYNNPALRDACDARATARGDAVCWRLNPDDDAIDVRYGNDPCKECLRDIGIEVGDDNDEFPE